MSIEKITEKIISEAQEFADTAAAEAKNQGTEITEKAKAEAEKILSDVHKKIKDETEKVFNRRKSLARLETRKMLLKAKQDAVNECFDKAIDEFANMEKSEYVSFLTDTLVNIGVDGGCVVFNRKDAESVGKEVVENANKAGKNFCVAEETMDSKGGFKIVSGKVEITATIESMIENIKEEITPDVVKALFN